jgi:hypothetical protein
MQLVPTAPVFTRLINGRVAWPQMRGMALATAARTSCLSSSSSSCRALIILRRIQAHREQQAARRDSLDIVSDPGTEDEQRVCRHLVLVLDGRHADVAAEDQHGDVSIGGVIPQAAAGLEFEQDDRDAATSKQRDLAVAISPLTRLVTQALALRRQVEQVLISDKALAGRCSLGLLRRTRPMVVLGVHATSLADADRDPW